MPLLWDLRDLTLRLSPFAVAAIRKEAAASADGRETGGILLGFDAKRGEPLVVISAGGPGPRAERAPTFFRRDLQYAERLAEEAFLIDSAQWVGDWHTHPRGGGNPSATDLAGYHQILDQDRTFCVFLAIIVIPGPARGWSEPMLCPWLIDRSHAAPTALRNHVVA